MPTNPLLQITEFPQFNKVQPEHIKPAVTQLLANNRANLEKLLAQKKFTWQNLIDPLEADSDRLTFCWSTVSHLNSVVNNPKLRAAYEECLPLIATYSAELGQNTKLYKAFLSLAKTQKKQLNKIQQKILKDSLRDFRLAGVALPETIKPKFLKLKQDLATLSSKFANNVLDVTGHWSLKLKKSQTQGIPELALQQARQANGRDYIFTLDAPSFASVITFADARAVRKKIYLAYVTRASKLGGHPVKWDNTKNITAILTNRQQLAHLLTCKNYAAYSVANKMAKTPATVLNFLNDLVNRSIAAAKSEITELRKFAKIIDGIKNFAPWDYAYYAEKLSQKKFAISQEQLREYFPINQVLQGLFTIIEKIFAIKIRKSKCANPWHKDVQFFSLYDANNKMRGHFFLDLYARANKRSGAWMDECMPRRVLPHNKNKWYLPQSKLWILLRSKLWGMKPFICLLSSVFCHLMIQVPSAFIICNFMSPIGKKTALLTHQDVITLFHEFGHCLQHVLTKIDYPAASGIHGIPWDAVELASQFMENFCWQPAALKLISKHYKTGKALSAELITKLLASKNHLAASQILRQLEYSLVDFMLHLEFNQKKIAEIIASVRKKVSIIPPVKSNRVLNSFLHIFAGEYAAGYYSYKWAEVLSADAFAKFVETGIFSRQTGQEFLKYILETGGSADPMVLFKKFRGRKPKIDALLKHYGIN